MSEHPAHRAQDRFSNNVAPSPAAAESTSGASGFRAQNRFTDPASDPPPEWTAPTPPNGLPRKPEPIAAAPLQDDPPPYLDLSTVALLGQRKRAPSEGWRKWLYWASFKLINAGESPADIHRRELIARCNGRCGAATRSRC